MKRLFQACIALLLLGCIKLPMEQAVSHRMKEARLLSPIIDLGLGENLGQMGFAASLGGMRSLVAAITYMRAYMAFENIAWGQVDSWFQLACRLQPRDELYWDEASWHMAFNAASSYLRNQEIEPIMRGKLYQSHIERGVTILQEGLRFNPESLKLQAKLGDIYARRTLEPVKAADLYNRVADLGGPSYYRRLAAYQWLNATDRDSWLKAYEILTEVYQKGQKFPSVIQSIKELERRLEIPNEDRIPDQASGVGASEGPAVTN